MQGKGREQDLQVRARPSALSLPKILPVFESGSPSFIAVVQFSEFSEADHWLIRSALAAALGPYWRHVEGAVYRIGNLDSDFLDPLEPRGQLTEPAL